MNDFLQTIEKSINIKKRLVNLESEVNDAISLLYKTLKRRNKVLICGNGGSAADAQHLAAEFLVRLRPKVNRRPYPVISLAQDTSTITACGNDLGFENIFQRNFEALASKDDVLVIFSTSGNSKNILKVLKYAKKRKISSIAFLGNNGGKSKKLGKIEIIVPEKNTARIQECHIFLGHFIFEQVENLLIRNDKN
jgi:D-sedoheptulose 7-phosphate isomerase